MNFIEKAKEAFDKAPAARAAAVENPALIRIQQARLKVLDALAKKNSTKPGGKPSRG